MKFLIVDDVKGWRDYHSLILKNIFSDIEIDTAESAQEAYNLILENNLTPYDLIITDMQMESDFEPLYAGEWLIEHIKTFKKYLNAKIIIISATYNLCQIAEKHGCYYVRKSTAQNFPDSYNFIKEIL